MIDLNNDAISEIDGVALEDLKELEDMRHKLIGELSRSIAIVAMEMGLVLGMVSERGEEWVVKPEASAVMNSPRLARAADESRRRLWVEAICDNRNLGQIYIDYEEGREFMVQAVASLIDAALRQLATERREEALLEELSASWESLEAVYEISSYFHTLQTPTAMLERIVGRAVAIQDSLRAILWIAQGPKLEPLVCRNASVSAPKMPPDGLVGRVIATRKAVVINGLAWVIATGEDAELSRACSLAIFPIATRQGILGALEVWREDEKGEFDSSAILLLQVLALQAAMVVENDKLHKAAIETERLLQEIEIGSKIQQTLLLGQPPKNPAGMQMAAFTMASRQIDGDFYDFLNHNDRCVDVIIGDVMGKGIPAALLGAATKSSFLRALNRLHASSRHVLIPEPEQIVRSVHDEVTGQLMDFESFTTLCHARFDTELGRVSFVDCGHTRTIHYRHERRKIEFLQGLNVPLGFSEKETYIQSSVTFDPGDIFIFYSDGLTEARNPAGELFGEDRLADCVRTNYELGPELLIDRIRAAVVAFSGSETFADDLTCIVVKIQPLEVGTSSYWSARIESDLKDLEQSRAFVRDVCRQLPIAQDAVSALELAVNEAASNIIRHAYHEQSGCQIELEAETVGDSLEIRLYHEGEGFTPDPSYQPTFDGSRDGGFGLYIIEHCADAVTYARDERGRNYIGLVKKL